MSSSADIEVCCSKSTTWAKLRSALGEVFDSTFGHAGALVSYANKSNNSDTELLLSFAATVILHNVIEKPGPFREVSKAAAYIFVGLIRHFVSGLYQYDLSGKCQLSHLTKLGQCFLG
jgi:hypothetical protein